MKKTLSILAFLTLLSITTPAMAMPGGPGGHGHHGGGHHHRPPMMHHSHHHRPPMIHHGGMMIHAGYPRHGYGYGYGYGYRGNYWCDYRLGGIYPPPPPPPLPMGGLGFTVMF